jgi:integral membrane protein (TIGR01906 family)
MTIDHKEVNGGKKRQPAATWLPVIGRIPSLILRRTHRLRNTQYAIRFPARWPHQMVVHRQVVQRLVVLALPFWIGLGWLTLLVGPTYPRYAYGRPDLPPDPVYDLPDLAGTGLIPLSPAERLDLALVAVAFLQSPQPPKTAVYLLAEQQLPHTGEPLYNERELAHMVDVKRLTDRIRRLALLTAVVVGGGLLWLLRRPLRQAQCRLQTRQSGYLALGRGGLLTLLLLGGLLGLIGLGWPFFFYQFHGLFFAAGTWSFAPTDSLMRLFPERFFFEFALLAGLGAWLWGLLAVLIGYGLAWRLARVEEVKVDVV